MHKISPMSNKSTADNLLSSQKVDDISENSEEDGNTIKKSVKFQPKPNSAGPGQLQTKLKSILFGGAKAKQQQVEGGEEAN